MFAGSGTMDFSILYNAVRSDVPSDSGLICTGIIGIKRFVQVCRTLLPINKVGGYREKELFKEARSTHEQCSSIRFRRRGSCSVGSLGKFRESQSVLGLSFHPVGTAGLLFPSALPCADGGQSERSLSYQKDQRLRSGSASRNSAHCI